MRIMELQLAGSRWEQIMVLRLISLRFSRISNNTFTSRSSVMVCSRKSSRISSAAPQISAVADTTIMRAISTTLNRWLLRRTSGHSAISNRCRCHRTAAVDRRTSCRRRPPYAIYIVRIDRTAGDLMPIASKQEALSFNFKKFMQYLGRTFCSVVLAPVLVFMTSFVVFFFDKTSMTLTAIVWECLYVDVLFSILTVCVVIVFSSEYKVQMEIKRCFGRESTVYPYLKKACIIMLMLLFVLGLLYKSNTGVPIQNNWFYNITEIISCCICIITQCIAHPEAYFCP